MSRVVSFSDMLGRVSTYDRATRGGPQPEPLSASKVYLRLRLMGYDLFGLRSDVQKIEITDEQRKDFAQ